MTLRFVDVLNLEQVRPDVWRAPPRRGPTLMRRLFGGQVAAQALLAASMCAPGSRPAHSLHATYLRPGDHAAPVDYEVTELRDGRSFTTLLVLARQRDRTPILQATASFHEPEHGLDHARDMPDVATDGIENLASLTGLLRDVIPERHRIWKEFVDLDIRPLDVAADGGHGPAPTDPRRSRYWARVVGNQETLGRLSPVALTYLTDLVALESALFPHGHRIRDGRVDSASLDHTLWFHRDVDAGDWLLLDHHSPWSGSGRGLATGHVYTPQGELVATFAQEGLLRTC